MSKHIIFLFIYLIFFISCAPNKKNKADNNILFDVYYKDKKIDEFKPKIDLFFRNILKYCSYLKGYSFKINTANTFPSGVTGTTSP